MWNKARINGLWTAERAWQAELTALSSIKLVQVLKIVNSIYQSHPALIHGHEYGSLIDSPYHLQAAFASSNYLICDDLAVVAAFHWVGFTERRIERWIYRSTPRFLPNS